MPEEAEEAPCALHLHGRGWYERYCSSTQTCLRRRDLPLPRAFLLRASLPAMSILTLQFPGVVATSQRCCLGREDPVSKESSPSSCQLSCEVCGGAHYFSQQNPWGAELIPGSWVALPWCCITASGSSVNGAPLLSSLPALLFAGLHTHAGQQLGRLVQTQVPPAKAGGGWRLLHTMSPM